MGHEANQFGTKGGAIQTIDVNTWEAVPLHSWKIQVRWRFGAIDDWLEWDNPALVGWWATVAVAQVQYFLQGGVGHQPAVRR